MKIRELLEVDEPKRQTRTKTKSDPLSDTFQRTFDKSFTDQDQLPTTKTQRPSPALRKASSAKTQQRLSRVQITPDIAKRLAAIQDLNLTDVLSDEDVLARAGFEEPTKTTDLPARTDQLKQINTAIVAASEVHPEWHQVRNLPGYFQQGIRAMGRQVFGAITSTPIEEIQVLANLMDSGEPNTKREINAVANWLKQNAERDTDGEINFQKHIPDYSAEFAIYKVNGQTFMLVKDFAGDYIYNWPSEDEEPTTRKLR